MGPNDARLRTGIFLPVVLAVGPRRKSLPAAEELCTMSPTKACLGGQSWLGEEPDSKRVTAS